MTLYGYDGCTPLRNTITARCRGRSATRCLFQFDQHGKEYLTNKTTSVINAWSDCNVGHTFAIPGLGLLVPVASPNAQLSADNLCSDSPCTPSGNPYAKETFSFMSPAHAGVFRWQCLDPCGGGFLDGNSGPMQTLGYMIGGVWTW